MAGFLNGWLFKWQAFLKWRRLYLAQIGFNDRKYSPKKPSTLFYFLF